LIKRAFNKYWDPELIILRGGDPNFATPDHIRDAAIRAIIDGYYHYAPMEGIPEFREAIAKYYSKYGVKYDSTQVYATAGGSAALNIAYGSLLKDSPGAEVIVTDPGYASNYTLPAFWGAKVVPVPLTEPNYHLNPDELRKRVTDKTKIIGITNPNNPTGTVFTRKELEAIAQVAIEKDLTVITDEFYSEYIYDGLKHIAISGLDGMQERTIVVLGATKLFTFTGWRLAALIVPKKLWLKVSNFAQVMGVRPAMFVQRAGAVGFNGLSEEYGWSYLQEQVAEYDRRRKVFVKRMNEIEGISCHMFEGAFYAFPDISKLGVPTAKFVEELRKREKVEVMDGERMGATALIGKASLAYGHLRPALTQDVDVCEEAANRIERVAKALKVAAPA